MKAKYIGECAAKHVVLHGIKFPEGKFVKIEDNVELFNKLVSNSHFETEPKELVEDAAVKD